MSDLLEGIRQELARVLRERDRIRSELSRRPIHRAPMSAGDLKGWEARELLFDISEALSAMGSDRFFVEYQTSASDLAKLIALCEDDAVRAGPLVAKDAEFMGNRIRCQII